MVNALRTLQYLTKRHPSRIRWLVHYKAPVRKRASLRESRGTGSQA